MYSESTDLLNHVVVVVTHSLAHQAQVQVQVQEHHHQKEVQEEHHHQQGQEHLHQVQEEHHQQTTVCLICSEMLRLKECKRKHNQRRHRNHQLRHNHKNNNRLYFLKLVEEVGLQHNTISYD